MLLRNHSPFPFHWLQAQLFDLSKCWDCSAAAPWGTQQPKGVGVLGHGENISHSRVRAVESLILTKSSFSSALLSTLLEQSAPRFAWRRCLLTASSHMWGRWEEAGATGSVITGQSSAGFVPCSILQVLSNLAEQFWTGNPGGELCLALRKEVLCLCNIQ